MARQRKPIPEPLWRLVGLTGKTVIDLLFATTPITSEWNEEAAEAMASRRFIAAFWHSRLLIFSHQYVGHNGVAMVSASNDGEIIARIIRRQGHRTVRGSTRRGGVDALARLAHILNSAPVPTVLIPDGPRGPRQVVQPGIIMLARLTGYPIVTMAYSARRVKIFASWDRFMLPRPFTRCHIRYGPVIRVPRQAPAAEMEDFRLRLESELNRITRETDALFGHRIA